MNGFSIFKDLAGLCNACDDLPIFRLEVQDTSGTVLQSVSSASLGVLNDDIWKRVVLNFTATTNQVNIVIINRSYFCMIYLSNYILFGIILQSFNLKITYIFKYCHQHIYFYLNTNYYLILINNLLP